MKRLNFIFSTAIASVLFIGAHHNSIGLIFTTSLGENLSQIDVIKKSFTSSYGKKLEINLETGAGLNIEGWEKEEIYFEIETNGPEFVEYDFIESSEGVKLVSESKRKQKKLKNEEKITIKVPKKFNLNFSTMGGSVAISSLEGNLSGKTMGGELNLKLLRGEMEFKTMGGEITLENSEADGKISTMGGDILLQNVIGDVDVSTMGGKIVQKNVKSKSNLKSDKRVKISTMGGDINVDEAPNGAEVKTMGGDITINSVSKYAEVETMGGNIFIRKADGYIKALTYSGNIEVKVIGKENVSGKDIDLKTLNGDITLLLPKDFSMDIAVETICPYGDCKDKIKSDFDLTFLKDNDKLIGKATIGDGKNKIRLISLNGVIILKKG